MKTSQRVIIVHGWDGYPTEGWFPWLTEELKRLGFSVTTPQLPEPEVPHIYNWVPALARACGEVDEHTYFVGHSMGCQTILRFLETLPEGTRAGGAVFVAGFTKHLKGLEGPEEKAVVDEWLRTPLDLENVKSHLPRSVALFSDNDPWVPLDNQDAFRDKLGSEILIQHGAGHFSGARDHCLEIPIVRDSLIKMAR